MRKLLFPALAVAFAATTLTSAAVADPLWSWGDDDWVHDAWSYRDWAYHAPFYHGWGHHGFGYGGWGPGPVITGYAYYPTGYYHYRNYGYSPTGYAAYPIYERYGLGY